MKIAKELKTLSLLAFGGMVILANPLVAQDDPPAEEEESAKKFRLKDNPRNGIGQKIKQLNRLTGALTEDVETQIDEYKAASEALREDLKAYLEENLGEDATEEEREAAVEQFREDNADRIAEVRDLRKDTMESVRDVLRNDDGDLPDVNIRRLVNKYKQTKQRLHHALRKLLSELPDDATEEQIQEAKDAFEEQYADVIARNQALGQQIRELLNDDETLETETVDRSVLSPELRAHRDTYRDRRNEILANHKALREQLKEMDKDERDAAVRTMREQLRADLLTLKDERREAIKERIENATSDRRPED